MSEKYTFKLVRILKLGMLSIRTAHENVFYNMNDYQGDTQKRFQFN